MVYSGVLDQDVKKVYSVKIFLKEKPRKYVLQKFKKDIGEDMYSGVLDQDVKNITSKKDNLKDNQKDNIGVFRCPGPGPDSWLNRQCTVSRL